MSDDEKTEDRAEAQTSDSAAHAKDKEDAWDTAHDKMRELEKEDNPPTDLKEWPDDEAKYVTYGGGEGDHGYDEGPEKKLGPSSLERHEDGSVTIEGEAVDNPDDYKADEPVQAAVESTKERKENEDEDEEESER